MHVIIIGAGIGGLCSAIALQQANISFTLYERSPSLRASGAAISLWPNASRILEQFGILKPLIELGQSITQTRIHSDQGQVLTGVNLEAFSHPAFCIQRAQLQAALAQQIPAGSIQLGHTLSAITQTEKAVTARFENGVEATADLLIAADGIYSTTRSLLWSTSAPKYQGYMAWRGVLSQPVSNWPSELAAQYWGKGQRFGLLSMGNSPMYWFASLNSQTIQNSPKNRKEYMTERFQGWTSQVREAIALTEEANIIVRPIETAPSLKQWHQGRVVLLGDAAHAMTPNLGQGACMAIEDAAVLAQTLNQSNTVLQDLTTYERQRRLRVSSVALRSYLLGQVGQIEGQALSALRTIGLTLAPRALLQLSFRMLFGG